MAARQISQPSLRLCNLQFPMSGVCLAAGQCTLDDSIWFVRQAYLLWPRILAASAMSSWSAVEDRRQLSDVEKMVICMQASGMSEKPVSSLLIAEGVAGAFEFLIHC